MLQTIFSNNKLVLEAVERAEPVLRRLAGKMTDRLREGGRIFCLGSGSPVPGEYGSDGIFFPLSADAGITAAVTNNDIFIAVDDGSERALAGQLRAWRRRGMLTACLTCLNASPVASAAEIAVNIDLATVVESSSLKERAALQMALDALLTLALAESGADLGDTAAKDDSGDAVSRAAAALMKEFPALDRESAEELIQRHGSVRKAAKAYQANVQGKL